MLYLWSEFLAHKELRKPEVMRLLEGGPCHPIVAVRQGDDLGELGQTIVAWRARGLKVGVWPLLSEGQGYWPNERNLSLYAPWVEELLGGLGDVKPDLIAVDLEPPILQIQGLTRNLLGAGGLVRALRHNLDARAFEVAQKEWRDWVSQVQQAHQLEVMAVALPMVGYDLWGKEPLWQDVLESPWAGVPWDRVGIMAYGSMVQGYAKGLLRAQDVRAIHFELMLKMRAAFGPRAHVALGITGTGKFGDEPVYECVEPLVEDLASAYAAGIEDVSIFCLEGLLARPDAEDWVRALRQAKAKVPRQTVRAKLVNLGALGIRGGLKLLRV